MAEQVTLLPLGTAVRIKNDDDAYIIISRGFQKGEDGKLIAGYRGVPHPYGESTKYKKILIAEKNILEILRTGYTDKKDEGFIQAQLGNATEAPTNSVEQSIVQPQTTPQVSTPQKVGTVSTPNTSFTIDPKDPFKNLRNRGN